MIYRINVLEERRKQKENCCGGNGPNCKCSSTPTPRQQRRNSMVEFFESMKKNYISKK